jgi:hypothetical protein
MAIGAEPPPGIGTAEPQAWRSAWFRATRGCARASISIVAAPRSDDLRAFTREGECRGAADTGQRARDENNLLAHLVSPFH